MSDPPFRDLPRQELAGTFRITPEREVLDCNDVFARTLGWPDRDALLTSKASLDAEGPEGGALGQLGQAGGPARAEIRLRRRDGTTVWVAVSGWPGSDASGRRVVYGITVDVSDRREMEARLLQSERLASVGTLAAGVAHEVNNPLSYVIANLGYAQEQVASVVESCRSRGSSMEEAELGQAIEALEEARQGAERVRSIVRDLRMYARADDERRKILELDRVVDSALNVLSGDLAQRARLVRDFEPCPPVFASEGRLGQALVHLLLNACQSFSRDDPQRNEIRVAVAPAPGGRVRIEVSDNGVGMSPGVLARAPEPFFTTRKPGTATGLGLAIAKSVVTSLGGELSLESQEGLGTRARVLLPSAAPGPGEATPAAPTASPAAPAGRRVLVIDDDPIVGQAVKRLLQGNEVVKCTEAAAALALLARGPRFHVILCDLHMPGTSGMDLYRQLVEEDAEAAARVAFITAGAYTEEASEFLDSVPNERLEKPFDASRLRALVANAPALDAEGPGTV